MVLKRVLPNLKDLRGKWASNYEGPYVVKQAFSRGALILTNPKGEDLKYLVNADSTNKICFQNAPRNGGFLSKAKLLAFQLSPWSTMTGLNEPVPGINVYRTKQKWQRQKKKSRTYPFYPINSLILPSIHPSIVQTVHPHRE
ncbi:hypothetical protein CR513_48780, partial [Mucuna pruriens]